LSYCLVKSWTQICLSPSLDFSSRCGQFSAREATPVFLGFHKYERATECSCSRVLILSRDFVFTAAVTPLLLCCSAFSLGAWLCPPVERAGQFFLLLFVCLGSALGQPRVLAPVDPYSRLISSHEKPQEPDPASCSHVRTVSGPSCAASK
jgi:hypothetical protein